MTKQIKLLFFGLLRDIMGNKEIGISIEENQSVNNFLEYLSKSNDSFKQIYNFITDKKEKRPVVIMLNGNTVEKPYNEEIQPGDEVAFLPPIGGG